MGIPRGINPDVFDELTAFLLNAGEWSEPMFRDGRELFMDGIAKRFRNQNRLLPEQLAALEPSGLVNPAVYGALDRFDDDQTVFCRWDNRIRRNGFG